MLVVAGVDSSGLARLPSLLHRAGCDVTCLAPPTLAVTRSRFVDRLVAAPPQLEALAPAVERLLAQRQQPFARVILGDEPALHALAAHRGAPGIDALFPVDPHGGAFELLTSKTAFLAAAARAGLDLPRWRTVADAAELRATAREFGYPVFLKKPTGCAGVGVRRVESEVALRAVLAEFWEGRPLDVQQCVRGRIGSTDVLFARGRPCCWISSYSSNCWPTPLASSSTRTWVCHADVEPMLAAVGRLTGFDGLAGIDWIHDADTDRLTLIELNPRPTPGYRFGARAGVDFAAALRGWLQGESSIQRPRAARQTEQVVHLFPQALYRAIDERDPALALAALRDAPWDDPGLLLACSRRVLTHGLPDGVRQSLRRWLRRAPPPANAARSLASTAASSDSERGRESRAA